MSQGWHSTVAVLQGGADCQLLEFQEREWLKREPLGFEVFLCLGKFREKFQGQTIDLHLWFFKQVLHAQTFLIS